ncbi:MAG: TonB-dependent receptor [Bryobacterales bacterium]|nr:TonB-dependent receptor [Bryobacterales bacterium]
MAVPKRLLLGMLLACATAPLFGQAETGQITGTVLDPAGAVVAAAKITATEATTNTSRSTTSTNNGTYVISNLLPGVYDLTATAPGFQTVKERVVVPVGGTIGVDIKLTLGQTSTVVEVVGNIVQINTETQTLSHTLSGQEIRELPTLTRNPYDLVQTAGNVSDGDPGGRGAGVAINGLRATSTNLLLDGVPNNNEFAGDIGIKIPLDSVDEFSVLTNNFTAEYGRAAGGVINVATRRGTNDYHGTVYEFNRVSDFASNTFENNSIGIKKPVFVRNQFGYSLGGPILKDKLFVFNNTEWIRVRSAATQTGVVATPQLIAASAPNTQQFFQQFGQLKPNAVGIQTFSRGEVCTTGPCTAIPASTPIYQKVAYNVPADSGGGDPQNTWLVVGRVDYNPSDKTQIYFRFAGFTLDTFPGTQTNSPYVGFDTADFQVNRGYAVSITRILSPKAVSQTKLSFNRISDVQPLGARPVVPTLYTNLNTTLQLGNSNILYPGYSPNTPGNAVPFGGPQNFATVLEDFHYTLGNHTLSVGGQYTYFQDNRTFGAYQEAVEALGTNIPTAVNGLVMGQLHDFQAAIFPQGKFPCHGSVVTPDCTLTLPVGPPSFSRSNRFHEAGLYVQDSWKVTPHLTLNLGLRWDYYGPQANKDPRLDSNFFPGPGANIELQSGTGQVLQSPNSPIGGLWRKDWDNFAPRTGFAWDIFGDGKTALRGGYSIGYERNFNNVTFNVIQNPPNYGVIALTAGTDLPVIPLTTDNAGPLAGTTGTKALPPVSLRAIDPNITTSYAHLWSVAIERQLTPDAVVSVEYSGSHGVNLYTIDRLNMGGSAIVYAGTGGPTTRINNQYSLVNFRTNGGSSLYNGGTVRLTLRNFRRYGLTLQTTYTLSHAIDENSSTFTSDLEGQQNLGLLDPLHPGLDRGSSDFDVRHRYTLAAVYESPSIKASRVMDLVAGGWSFAPIFTARTGTPFTVWDCTNETQALCPRVMFSTPFQTRYTDIPTANPNEFNYLNLGTPDSTYVNPLTGSSDFGPFPGSMTGRNVFRTPGVWKFSIGAYKTFAINERIRLQLRGEAFNLFNHSNLYLVYSNTEVSSMPVGSHIVTAIRGLRNDTTAYTDSVENGRIENRNLQLALKLIF